MAVTMFRAIVPSNESIGAGSGYSRYMSMSIPLYSGDVVPSGAVITSVVLNATNVTVWNGDNVNTDWLIDDVPAGAREGWGLTGENMNLNKVLYTTAGLWTGKSAVTLWVGFASGMPRYNWCSFRSGCIVTISVAWEGQSRVTLDKDRVDAGGSITVGMSRLNASYTHKVRWGFGSHSSETSGVATQNTLTIPMNWLDAIPNATSGTAFVTVTTYNGQSAVGSTTRNFTILCPDSVVPSPGILTVGMTNDLDGKAVQGKTRVTPSLTGYSGVYGSTIVGSQFSHSGLLNESGTINITATVTDTRGRSASISQTVYVWPYTAPAIDEAEVFRCDASGTASDSGEYVKVSANLIISDVDGANSIVRRRVLVKHNGDYVDKGLLSPTPIIIPGIDADKTYAVKLLAEDAVGTVTEIVFQIGTAGYLMYVRKDGKGVAFGKACESENSLEIPEDWDIRRGNKGLLDLIYPVGSIYMSTAGTSPAVLFGGTWEQVKDRFLLAAGDSYAAGATGGEDTHVLTTSEMPSHSHGEYFRYSAGDDASVYGSSPITATGTAVAYMGSTANTGGGEAHNNMPPYLAVYVWRRTA